MAEGEKSAVIDIENELTCSICTELLYQPLTLLDCLHTFCGSCLQEWFSWQASQASTSKPNPFSCPSCRAPVRETRPNATVTTLLEMYMKVNPGKGKTEEEKVAIAQGYKPGDSVMPKLKHRKETAEEQEDRRMIEEARNMSLRDIGIRSGRYERGVRHQPGEERGRELASRRPQTTTSIPDLAARAGQISHQNSLRSILSSSDLGDSVDIEEEILRQIMEDGILEGIDLNHLSVSQEEELTEKIAEAYRRRHGRRRSREREHRATNSNLRSHQHDPAGEPRGQRRQPRASDSATPSTTSSQLGSRPHLLDPGYPTAQRHSRRTLSENQSHTSPDTLSHPGALTDTQRQAARSATDLSNRLSSTECSQRRERSAQEQRRTGSDRLQPNTQWRERSVPQRGSRDSASTHRMPSSSVTAPGANTLSTNAEAAQGGHHDEERTTRAVSSQSDVQSPNSPQAFPTVPTAQPMQPAYYRELSISCKRCGKPDLEYMLHWNCTTCEGGSYNICQRCYLLGKGCLHWYGFGSAAMARYERSAPPGGHPPNQELPHRLTGHKYLPPPPETVHPTSSPRTTTIDPTTRLQSGPFCSTCSTFALTYYWQCGTCNEGEWGFCNSCVQQGRCCTHALLPVALTSCLKSPPTSPSPQPSPSHNPFPTHNPTRDAEFTTLSISTHCDSCTYPIPPSTTRYHCPRCNSGDYDLCTSCYVKFVKRGTISSENGPKGWRKCPQGHRMAVVGFEDSGVGQRRVVVEDLVGGHRLTEGADGQRDKAEWSWRDGDTGRRQAKSVSRVPGGAPDQATKPFPPSGGVGMRVQALWSYWGADETVGEDELGFPRGAEIKECEDINGDWFWGFYCARSGLFPGGYGRVVRRVG